MTKTADTDPEDNEITNLPTVALGETLEREGAVAPSAPVAESEDVTPLDVRGVGLGTKFFLAVAGLVTLALGTALAFTTWQTDRIAERTIREALANVPTMFRAYRTDLQSQLLARVGSLAEAASTKALYAPEVSVATRYDFAREQAELLGAKTLFLFDYESLVLARSDKEDGIGVGKPFGRVPWVADPLWKRRDAAAAIVEKGELALVASVAVLSGEGEEAQIDGVLAAAFPLTAGEVEALRGITRGEVAFITNTARRGEPPTPVVTAATADFRPEQYLAAVASDPRWLDGVLTKGEDMEPLDLDIGGESRIVTALPIRSSSDEVLGAFVVARSRSEETAAFRTIRTALLGIGLGVLLLSFPISFIMGRRVARPLEQLTRGAIAIREGKLDVKLPGDRNDEVGSLARAFQRMVDELKEKRALQDLLEEMGRRGSETVALSAPLTTPEEGGLVVGKVFGGRYEIVGTLGKGGMGQVFQAKDVELDDVVAIKVLSPEAFKQGAQAIETLKREIRLARKITHPNVVRVHDFAEAEGVRYVTMEYVPGTTLRALVSRGRKLDLGPGLQIAKQLCRGLGAIHQAGILHRDMKPENVMVLPNGMVKLMDFGIAEVFEERAKDGKKSDTVVGTPTYMSPEQLRGEQLDQRCDLYALGVILYEVFSGVQPFRGKNLTEIVRRIVNEPVTSLAQQRPGIPEGLGIIVMKCLEKQRDSRPTNAGEIYRVLLNAAG